MNLSPKAQSIVDALAIGGLTSRQVAELQAMYFELEDWEQDAVDRWTSLGRQIRGIVPGSTNPDNENWRARPNETSYTTSYLGSWRRTWHLTLWARLRRIWRK